MIEKRVVFHQVECTQGGEMQIRVDKQIVDGGAVIAHEYHRMVIEPGEDLDTLLAGVNSHLATMGYPAIEAGSVERIRRLIQVEHSAPVVAAYGEFRKARDAAMAATTQAQKITSSAEIPDSNKQAALANAEAAVAAMDGARRVAIEAARAPGGQ